MNTEEFSALALSFPGTIESPHFDRIAFKIINKRIFTTMHEKTATANVKLTRKEQSVFCAYDKHLVYPVPNKWGLQGWTTFELAHVPKELMLDALESAYNDVLNKKSKK